MPSDIVNSIIMAEEIAREQKIILKDRIKKFKTYVIDWKNFIYDNSGSHIFLSETGEGKIEELVIISPSDNFSLFIEIDGIMTYQGAFSHFEGISTQVSSVVAQQRGTSYILQINDIIFLDRILILIDTDAAITFTRLYCKYQLAVKE